MVRSQRREAAAGLVRGAGRNIMRVPAVWRGNGRLEDSSMRSHPFRGRLRRGITLTELLVVLAVLALLIALLMPTMGNSSSHGMRRATCMSNMLSLIQAVRMYHDDWGVYPDARYGYQPAYPGAPFQQRLYPDYVKDERTFHCPNSPAKGDDRVLVSVTNPMTGLPHWLKYPPGAATLDPPLVPVQFYRMDSYDFQYRTSGSVVNATSADRALQYHRKWTTLPAGSTDRANQLAYKDPPDSTVVCWCVYHTDRDANGAFGQGGYVIAGFLSGAVQKIPVREVPAWDAGAQSGPWNVRPKE
jgi:prepilin-type N-terminal cleavage/methylation domain-containing protein